MRILIKGHRYALPHVNGEGETIIDFQNKEPGMEQSGVTSQELTRMLIERTYYCHNCLPHRVNEQIIWHYRMAIALHEARALEQRVSKGDIKRVEHLAIGKDGHILVFTDPHNIDPLAETSLKPVPPLGAQTCDHRSNPAPKQIGEQIVNLRVKVHGLGVRDLLRMAARQMSLKLRFWKKSSTLGATSRWKATSQ